MESYADFAELAFGDLGRQISSIASTSALLGKICAKIGPVVCVLCVLLAWSAGASAMGDLHDFPEACRGGPGGEAYTNIWPHVGGTGTLDFVLSVANIMAYGFYCFAVVVTVPSLKGKMKEPSQVVSASSKAYGLCTVLFLVIM